MEDPATARISEAYARAVQAHAVVQARYATLNTEIRDLRSASRAPLDDHHQPKHSVKTHIPLLRQRAQMRKLQVIEQALSDINQVQCQASPNTLFNAVDDEVGDRPIHHSFDHGNHDRHLQMDPHLMKLKKAVLAKRRETDQLLTASLAKPPLTATAVRSPASEVIGLRRALHELTEWMERQLSVAGDAEIGNKTLPENLPVKNDPTAQPPSTADVEALYEQYVAARRKLIGTLNNRVTLSAQVADEVADVCNNLSGAEPDTNASETLLPFLATLASTKQEEQAFLMQSAYTRRQISSAENDLSRLLARLADESHLVQPGSIQGSDWAEAASEASQSTAQYVRLRLQAGEQAVERGKKALNDVESVSQLLAALKAGA